MAAVSMWPTSHQLTHRKGSKRRRAVVRKFMNWGIKYE
jgi:hypothetical protein